MNPYFGKNFFSFFSLLFFRFWQFITGSLPLSDLASDEIQIIVLSLVCISSALVGSLLVLKKMTMLANSLSHTILLGIIIAAMIVSADGYLVLDIKTMLLASLISGVLTTLLTEFFHKGLRLQEDASIGLVFSSLFALSIALVTIFTRNSHIGQELVMGSADALHIRDLKLAFWTAFFCALVVFLFFKEWKLICFDSSFGKSTGMYPQIFRIALMLLTSLTAISSFRAIGVLLFLAFMVGLPLSARMLTFSLKYLILFAITIGIVCSLCSVAFCRHLLSMYQIPLSTTGMTVTLIGGVFVVTVWIKHWFLKPISS